MSNENKTTILMALTVGAVIGHHIDDIVEHNYPPASVININEHPIEKEYEILNACINSDKRPISRKVYNRRKEICICSLRKLEKETPNYFQLAEYVFYDKFNKNTRRCNKELQY